VLYPALQVCSCAVTNQSFGRWSVAHQAQMYCRYIFVFCPPFPLPSSIPSSTSTAVSLCRVVRFLTVAPGPTANALTPSRAVVLKPELLPRSNNPVPNMGIDVVRLICAKVMFTGRTYPLKRYGDVRPAGFTPDGQDRRVQGTPNPPRRRKTAQCSPQDSRRQTGPAP
jgi:hypothetical protein